MNTLKKLSVYMGNRKIFMPIALLLSALSTILGMLPYIYIWFIVRELFVNKLALQADIISSYAIKALIFALASVICYFLALTFSHLAAFRVETNIRRVAMKKVISLPLGFFNANTTGRIRKIIDSNASTTHGFIAHQLPDLASTVLVPVIILILIFVFDWRLGLVFLVPVLFSMGIMSSMMTSKGKRSMKLYMNSLEEMSTEAVEYVRGIPVVKVFQQTIYSFKNFHNSILNYKKMVLDYTVSFEKPMSAYTAIINGFVYFLVPATILIMTNNGNYATSILNLFLYILITPIFSQCLMRSSYLMSNLTTATEAVNRLENLIAFDDLPYIENPKPINDLDIEFRNVSFAYPGSNNKAIDNISFKIKKGTTTALVGASGSGKTTIARLLPRFWDADEGSILIGNVNVKEVSSEELMKNIAFVFQNTKLFKLSLLDNIRYGKPNASLAEVNRAVDLAQCREIIDRLPDGLNTKIGTDGTYLSGGERQRIVIARAILKDAPIIVLDEATAFADPENEHLIQKAFKKLTETKTVLMIAHRLTTVTGADNILVVKEGKIIEAGTHQDLLEKKGDYNRMWEEFQHSINWRITQEVQNV